MAEMGLGDRTEGGRRRWREVLEVIGKRGWGRDFGRGVVVERGWRITTIYRFSSIDNPNQNRSESLPVWLVVVVF